MKQILFSGLIFLFSACLSAVEEFHFKKNVAYTVEYLVSENKTESYENMFFVQDDWVMETGLESSKENSNAGSKTSELKKLRKLIEFLQVHPNGKREQQLLDCSRIVRLSNVTLDAVKTPVTPSESSPPKNESLDIAFTK